jgi:hypothetical protein
MGKATPLQLVVIGHVTSCRAVFYNTKRKFVVTSIYTQVKKAGKSLNAFIEERLSQ